MKAFGTGIKADPGVAIYISPKKHRDRDYYSELWFMRDGNRVELIRSNISNIAKIEIPYEKYNTNGEKIEFQVITRYVDNNEEIGWATITVQFNSFRFTEKNAGCDLNTTECNNATIENNTMYIKPGSTVNLTTTWTAIRNNASGSGVFYKDNIAGPNTAIDSYTYTAPSNIGNQQTIYWRNEFGAASSLKVIVSNFAKPYFNITPLANSSTNLSAETYNNAGTTYPTTRNFNVEKDTETVIKIEPQQQFANKKAVISSLRVWDISNFSGSTLTAVAHETCYTIRFSAKQDGLFKMQYVDYLGNTMNYYWKVKVVDSVNTILNKTDTNNQEIGGQGTYSNNVPSNSDTNTYTEVPIEVPTITYESPKITYTVDKVSSNSVKYNFTISGGTAVKYKIAKSVENVEVPTNYSTFDGKEIANASSFSVTLSSAILGSGYFDVIVIAKNTEDYAYSGIAIGPNYINTNPIVGISKKTKESKANSKKYVIYGNDADKNDSATIYYYVQPKARASSYTQPSIETIKTKGTKINGTSENVTIDTSKYTAGYYDITAYAEDKNGSYNTAYISNITISECPEITYFICGEKGTSAEGYTYSTQRRNTQKFQISVNDKDKNNTVNVWYIISEEDLTKKGTVVPQMFNSTVDFINSGNKYYFQKINSNTGTFEIDIPVVEGKYAKKYVYICAQDNLGATTFLSTGTILVDDSPLTLSSVYANKANVDMQNEKIGYHIGENLEVTLKFNHTMQEIYPDLYMNFGETERKQDSVKCSEDEITYVYTITAQDVSGDLSFSRIDYSNKVFTDNYKKQNEYELDFTINTGFTNSIEGKYYIDTIQPELEDIEIALTTDSDSTIYDDTENNIKYISNLANAKLKMTYSEEIKNKGPVINMLQGKKSLFILFPDEKQKRTQDVYNLTPYIQQNSFLGIDGEIELKSFHTADLLSDLAGNWLVESEAPTVKYTLNGQDTGDTKIVLDDNVYTGKIMIGDSNVTSDAAYVVDTQIMCFAEYKNGYEDDYKDESGISKIQLKVWENNTQIVLQDKNGTTIEKDLNVTNEDAKYTKVSQYTLEKTQLPVTFVLEQEGNYKISTLKQDNAGNTEEKTVEITATAALEIVEEESGLKKLNSSEYYNYIKLQDSEKEYTLALKLDETIQQENIEIKLYDNLSKDVPVTYVGEKTGTNGAYQEYKFGITQGGQYVLEVYNKETETVILKQTLEVYNVYNIGDTNYDGLLNAQDLVMMKRYLVGFEHDEKIFYAGDVTGDNLLTISDIILLTRYICQDSEITRNPNTGYIQVKNN